MNKPKPFPKGDIRRYLTLLAAIYKLGDSATLVHLERETGHNRGTISTDIGKIRALQLGYCNGNCCTGVIT